MKTTESIYILFDCNFFFVLSVCDRRRRCRRMDVWWPFVFDCIKQMKTKLNDAKMARNC